MMARSPASKAASAAEALDAFLRDRAWAGNSTAESNLWTAGGEASPDTFGESIASVEMPPAAIRQLAGTGTAFTTSDDGTPPLQLPHTDWLLHRMVVAGPAAAVDAFRKAATGAGTIPWQLDLDSLEEDWFHRLIHPSHRQLSLAGARILAAQLRDAVEHRHTIAVSRVGHSHACPFDLHALVQVPDDILALGPDHPKALAWLWQHWGTTQPLRHVADEAAPTKGDPLPLPAEDRLRLRFWSADWTPWRALARIRADWPALCFDVQPEYGSL